MSLDDRLRCWFKSAADVMAEPLAIILVAALWLPWAVWAQDLRSAIDHWLTGGAFTGFQMVLAGQRVERAASAAQNAALVKANPDVDDRLADADRLTLNEVEEMRR